MLREAVERNDQLLLHTVGDKAVETVLSAMEAVDADVSHWPARRVRLPAVRLTFPAPHLSYYHPTRGRRPAYQRIRTVFHIKEDLSKDAGACRIGC